MSKLIFFAFSFLVLGISNAQADKLDKFGILRYDDGAIHLMTYKEMMKTSCPASTHLPTIRELAIETQSRGAKGILEVTQVNPKKVPRGYDLIQSMNVAGQLDQFYFSYEGYNSPYTGPEADLGTIFWSRSWLYDYEPQMALELHGLYAWIHVISVHNYNFAAAIRCFPGR